MGGGSSKKTATTEDPMNGVFPDDEDEPTSEQLKAAEEANETLRTVNASNTTTATSDNTKAKQEAADLANEFAADITEPLPLTLPLTLNFQAIQELWFSPGTGGKGKSLVQLKDTVQSLSPLFSRMYQKYTSSIEKGMTVFEFVSFVKATTMDLDEAGINSHFFECTKYPEDEDDAEEMASITANAGQFASAVVRIANAYIMQEFGESEKGLDEQLCDWLTKFGSNVGAQTSDRNLIKVRDDAFFYPPSDFVGTSPKVYLLLKWGDQEGKVVIELNGTANPKCAYNFKCLCTGEKGVGELTGLPLCFQNCSFHRLVKDMCLQGGDIEGGDGYGGESIYGGEFMDSEFNLKHDQPGVVSMGNSGPNTNTSQFFITLAAAPHLDNENNAFGLVVEGMEILTQINELEVDEDDKPVENVSIQGCGLVE